MEAATAFVWQLIGLVLSVGVFLAGIGITILVISGLFFLLRELWRVFS